MRFSANEGVLQGYYMGTREIILRREPSGEGLQGYYQGGIKMGLEMAGKP